MTHDEIVAARYGYLLAIYPLHKGPIVFGWCHCDYCETEKAK